MHRKANSIGSEEKLIRDVRIRQMVPPPPQWLILGQSKKKTCLQGLEAAQPKLILALSTIVFDRGLWPKLYILSILFIRYLFRDCFLLTPPLKKKFPA